MDCVKCVCLMVFCLGAMAGLTEASPFSPISKFIPHPGKALEKPPHVEVPTQEDGVKLTGGVLGMPLKVIENYSETINAAISNGMGQKGHEESNRHEVKNLGEERHEGHGEQHEGHVEQHEGHVEQHEGHGEQLKGHGEIHEGHVEQHEGHAEQHEGHGEQHEGHVEQHEGHGEQHVDKEIKSRQRRNLPIPSTKVINSRPIVEPRYAVDSSPEPSSGAFLEGAKGIVIDEPNGLEQYNRPVIIYVNSVKKINFDSGSECRNCE